MFGDVFGTKTDYSKGILYASRRLYLVDYGHNQDLGPTWQPADRVQPPRAMMSKHQVKRELMRKKRVAQGTEVLRHLRFLEDIQEYSDRAELMRSVLNIGKKDQMITKALDKSTTKDNTMPSSAATGGAAPPMLLMVKSMGGNGAENNASSAKKGEPSKGDTPALKKGLNMDAMGRMLRKASASSAPGTGSSAADMKKEDKKKKEKAAWEYVPGPGHPYWINAITGAMQFENPYKNPDDLLNEDSQGLLPASGPYDDSFSFIDEWKDFRAPTFVTKATPS